MGPSLFTERRVPRGPSGRLEEVEEIAREIHPEDYPNGELG